MPQIHKQNIWELVSGKSYHSCLITTYSFDFYYFEKSVMRTLRSKGIGNISLFIDNNILQGILGKIGINSSRVYSINPIDSKGCFHPKVYMFFGAKQGLLIIGSGNLTSSGHGKNDEIWGAFHFDANEPKHTQLFANSWDFFQKTSENIKGFSKEKIKWIKEYSPWIGTLPTPNSSTLESIDESTKIAFLNNNTETSIFQQFSHLVPFITVTELTIVAPYFDTKGKIIELFYKSLPNAKINVLVDEKNGILPFGLDSEVAKNVRFYHWNDCFDNKCDNEKHSRLHAKIFHFTLADNSQFCLLGSANASVAALGTKSISATNEEVSILLNSTNKDYLKNLGIKINLKNQKKIQDFKQNQDDVSAQECFPLFKHHIEALDKEGNVLNIYADDNIETDTAICLFNNWGEELHKEKLAKLDNHYYIKIPSDLTNAMYGCLVNSETSEVLSNKQIIQDVHALARTNPDPKQQILDVFFSSIEQGDELLFSKLVDCISTNDFNAENKNISKQTTAQETTKTKQYSEIKGEVLEYDEFKNVSYSSMQHQYSVLNSSTNRVADFLTSLLIMKSNEDTASLEHDDEELDNNANDTQGREDHQTKRNSITISAFKSEKNRIVKFFNRYNDFLEKEVDTLLKKSNQNADKLEEITINELSNYVIALYIAIYYTDRKREYSVDEDTKYESIVKSFGFGSYESLPTISSDIIGRFSLLCTRGFKTYESDYLNERIDKLRKEAFYYSLFCISHAKWNKQTLKHKEPLLLNAMRFLPKSLDDLLVESSFLTELNYVDKLSSNENTNLIGEIKSQIDSILPKYSSFVDNMKLSPKDRKTVLSKSLMPETVIFTSRLGFCTVNSKISKDNGAELTLSRPGFEWDKSEEEYLIEKRKYVKNIII